MNTYSLRTIWTLKTFCPCGHVYCTEAATKEEATLQAQICPKCGAKKNKTKTK